MNTQKNRKMVFFDIDGTIVDGPTHQIPESTVRAIRRLRENGHFAFINTGRTLVSIEQRIRDIGFDGYVCGCGSRVYYGNELLFSTEIPHKRCVEIMEKMRECRITAFCEAPDAVYYDGGSPVKNRDLERSKEDFKRVGILMKPFPEEEESPDATFDKFFCLMTDESDVDGFVEFVKEDFYGTPQGKMNLEFVKKGRSKAEGIRLLQEKLSISAQDCYAIGDSENDLPMLMAVPNSIAMGVCSPKILPFCSYQTAAVTEDGIERALRHYGLI